MNPPTVTLELPARLYADLQALAEAEHVDLIDMLARFAKLASQHRAWVQGWEELREQIRQAGGLQVGATKDEVVEQMRRTRYAIFEAEYAHLYR